MKNKHIISLGIALALLCVGCKVGEGSLSTTKGLENECFLEFVGISAKYKEGVDVDIDGKTTFKAKVHNESEGNGLVPKADRFKGEIYAIPTGNHTVTIFYKGDIIYRKQIFLSSQETKKITLQ